MRKFSGTNLLILNLVEDFIRNISGPLGIRLRRAFYSRRLKSCGNGLVISEGVFIDKPQNMTFGNNIWIDKGVIFITGKIDRKNIQMDMDSANVGKVIIGDDAHIGIRTIIQAHGGIEIGNYFTSGSDTKLYTLSNDINSSRFGTNNRNKDLNFYRLDPISIGNNVWIGMQSTVLGSKVGSDVFIKPNAVCYSNIPQNSIVGGSPAQVIKKRFP